MQHRFSDFLAGVFVTATIGALSISALAATGQVSFNLSAVKFNGTQISARGETYALSNGAQAPASITYTDEKGGGTTYLPARRVSELLGVDIGYDSTAGAVTITGSSTTPPTTPAPSTDHSKWSAEEEAAYQEFKAMWRIEDNGMFLKANYAGSIAWSEFVVYWNGVIDTERVIFEQYFCRMAVESNPYTDRGINMKFYYQDQYLTQASVYASGNTHCYISAIN